MDRRWTWALGLVLIGACGGGDDSGGGSAPPPPPAAPRLTLGSTTNVTVVANEASPEAPAVNLDFSVAAAGNYQCRAHADGLDAQMKILQGATEVAMDSDSGGNFDALITRELAPGAYTVRVWEWRGRAATIQVTCTQAPALPVNPTTLMAGTPATVNVVAGEGPGSTVELAFAVAAPGSYQCDATSSLDAQMAIVQNGSILHQDSDSGGSFNARITASLAPGAYVVRVWEWQHRATAITVNCAQGAAAAAVPDGSPIALGTPAAVNVPAGEPPVGQVHLNLVIASPGTYTCDTNGTNDPQLAIVQGGNVLQQDDDSGPGVNARVSRDLAPGAYQVRVWEWLNRGTQVTVSCRPGATPPE